MTTYRIRRTTTTLPKGKYYIGDPCYVIDDDEWMDALQSTRYFNLFVNGDCEGEYNEKDDQHGVFERDGTLFAVSSTAYGDGEYPCVSLGSLVGTCGVDAGLIGAIPLEMIDLDAVNKNYSQGIEGLGCVVEFAHPFNIEVSDGLIDFGEFSVETGDSADGLYDEMEEYA